MGHIYADETQWDKVYGALSRAADRGDTAGLDSEFYNVEIRSQSCVARSRLHLWSVAIHRWPLQLQARGYYAADAAVLTAGAIEHHGLRSWLESSAPKAVHNLPVDAHTFHNAGVTVGGTINTLARSRFVWPERARGAGFDLDGLGIDLLAIGKTEPGWVSENWWKTNGRPRDPAVFVRIVEEKIVKQQKTKLCSCGVEGCRKRKGHERPVVSVEETKLHHTFIPMEEVVLGHDRWDRAVAYAARDSLVGLYLHDRIETEMRRGVPFPWAA